MKPVGPGKEFKLYFVLNWGIYLNKDKLFNGAEFNKIYNGNTQANYVQVNKVEANKNKTYLYIYYILQ
jgi:hypothetical protein